MQAQVDENLKKQAELMSVIDKETAAYKHAFGYTEWRSACEVGSVAASAWLLQNILMWQACLLDARAVTQPPHAIAAFARRSMLKIRSEFCKDALPPPPVRRKLQ